MILRVDSRKDIFMDWPDMCDVVKKASASWSSRLSLKELFGWEA